MPAEAAAASGGGGGGAILGELISGGFQMWGQHNANKANAKLAREQMAFQERMSNTAHTREVADLRNAGLNPVLSATGGSGASTPGGQTAQMLNEQGDAGNRVASAARLALETKMNREMVKTEQTKQNANSADALLKLEQTRSAEADVNLKQMGMTKADLEREFYGSKLGRATYSARQVAEAIGQVTGAVRDGVGAVRGMPDINLNKGKMGF